MPRTLYLLRHGQTRYNAELRLQGRCNSDLTAKGEAQATAMGARLRDLLDDPTRCLVEEQVRNGIPIRMALLYLLAATEAAERRERSRLIDLKGKLEAIIEANPTLRQFKNQILLDIINEGLRIQLIDAQNRPMFTSSSAELRPYTRELLRDIARALNDVDNRISMSGHTDSTQYVGGERGFSNWELSSNRANAARRELVAGGLEAGKMVRVVGLADTIHLVPDDPMDPANRRISIIVLNRQTEELFLADGKSVDVENLVNGEAEPAVP